MLWGPPLARRREAEAESGSYPSLCKKDPGGIHVTCSYPLERARCGGIERAPNTRPPALAGGRADVLPWGRARVAAVAGVDPDLEPRLRVPGPQGL